jgi:1-acyl-sn-glycerol-3-phosphate acyltransferase
MEEQNKRALEHVQELLEFVGRLVSRGGSTLQRFREEALSDLDERLAAVSAAVGPEGVDPFGMEPATLRRIAVGAAFLYKVYFRCDTTGIANVPAGPVIIVANHGGQLPIDGVMITTALLLEGSPPRLARSMVDHWVPSLPFVSTYLSRAGVAVGTPENAERLLSRGEVLLAFPEGMDAITKTVDEAYELKPFHSGFVRLALAAGAPIVPVAVVGSEEQYPTLYNLKGVGRMIGLPSLPVWAQMVVPLAGLLPLPVRYRLEFGAPVTLDGDPDDEDAAVDAMAEQVRDRVREMVDRQRAARRHIFW